MNPTNPNSSANVPAPATAGSMIVPQMLPTHPIHAQESPTTTASTTARFPTPGELLIAFRHRWGLALLVGLVLGGGLGTLVWYLKPAQYTATALLRVSVVEPQLLPGNRTAERGEGDMFQRTQMALVKTRPVLTAALQKANVSNLRMVTEQADPVTWLEEELKVSFIEGTELLKISLNGDDPREVAELVNAVKQTYLDTVANQDRKLRMNRLEELEKVLNESDANLGSQLRDLRRLSKVLNTPDAKEAAHQRMLAFDRLHSLETEQNKLKTQMREAQIELAMRGGAIGPKGEGDAKPGPDGSDKVGPGGKASVPAAKEATITVPEYRVEEEIERVPIIQTLQKEVVALEDRVHEYERKLQSGVAPDHVKNELKRANETLAKEKERLRPGIEEKLRKQIQSINDSGAAQQDARLRILESLVKQLQSTIEAQRKVVESLGESSFDLDIRKTKIDQYQSTINLARAEKEKLAIELQSTSQRVTEQQPAEVPNRRNMKPQVMSAGVAGFWGLLLGVVGVCYREYRARRIHGKDDLAQHLNLRVLGSLPILAGQRTRKLLSFGGKGKYDWSSALRESVDAIRATLMRNESTQARRVLMVTSPRSGEGKTTLSVHLATSIARSQRKTLLVDGDLHHPLLHRLFDLAVEPGLSAVLRGETELAEAIQASPVEGLFILPAGRRHEDATHLLADRQVQQLLAMLRQEFEYIIFDCSPVLPVADALLIGAHTDGVLLSVRPQLSQVPELQDACEKLHSARIPILGAVLNGVRVSTYAFDYPYPATAEA